MAYASAQDLKDRYPAKVLAELTDESGVTINDVALGRALASASADIDGYLRGRYALPFTDAPANLVDHACTIAFYSLMRASPQQSIEDAEKRYDKTIKWLRDVSNGVVQLSLSPSGNVAPQTEGPTIVTGGERVFSRDSLKGL